VTNGKLFFKLSEYLTGRFGEKVWKVPVDAGFTCPNRDGFKGEGGCIYCSVDSFDGSESGDIASQVKTRIEKLKKRNINKYIIYFQSYSNTYGSVDIIKERIGAALFDEGIVAVHIGTRPDVIDRVKLEYFQELNNKYEIVIEYGLQSSNDDTLLAINRGHSVRDFEYAVRLTHEYGIKTCAHVIFGLPGDTREDMINSVKLINKLGVHSVKFHHLHVVKGTKLAEMYLKGQFSPMDEDTYIEILSESIGRLGKDIVIARIVGDAAGETLIAPDWPKNKGAFEQKLVRYMEGLNIRQGSIAD